MNAPSFCDSRMGWNAPPARDSGAGDAHRAGAPGDVRTKLDRLRTELIDLAFVLETRGRLEAADVALATSARVGELCDELARAAGAITQAERVEPDAGFRATL